jgi:hypothetical protein
MEAREARTLEGAVDDGGALEVGGGVLDTGGRHGGCGGGDVVGFGDDG